MTDGFDDAELERSFAGQSDAELERRWDQAADWRDWFSCEVIYAEQERRERASASAKEEER